MQNGPSIIHAQYDVAQHQSFHMTINVYERHSCANGPISGRINNYVTDRYLADIAKAFPIRPMPDIDHVKSSDHTTDIADRDPVDPLLARKQPNAVTRLHQLQIIDGDIGDRP